MVYRMITLEHQDECIFKVNFNLIKASRLLRALKEVFNYLTTGEGDD